MAVVSAIVVAAVSFSLLTSAVATSRLEVKGTVEANYRSAYDILVRPPNSQTDLEQTERLVRNNFLSGIFGGISMRQYREVSEVPGVDVAAPIAMVGYVLPSVYLPVKIGGLVTDDAQQVYRARAEWVNDRGLTTVPDANTYLYVNGDRVRFNDYGEVVAQRDPQTGDLLDVCQSFYRREPIQDSPFDLKALVGLGCFSTTPGPPLRGKYKDYFNRGDIGPREIGYTLQYPFPLLLAAVDPEQEARLVGLDEAVESGRYLEQDERPRIVSPDPERYDAIRKRVVPVIMPEQATTDETLRLAIERLDLPQPRRVPSRLSSPAGGRWLDGLSGSAVRSIALSNDDVYPRVLRGYQQRLNQIQTSYWTPGQVDYERTPDGHLRPTTRRNDESVWTDRLLDSGYYAPQPSSDTGFRRLTGHAASNMIYSNVYGSPEIRAVGVFDAEQIEGFSELSQVPLTTYTPADAAPGDARSEALLGGQALLPNSNLAGYLQQPPMMLTNLRSLGEFTDPQAYLGVSARTQRKPISVIRIRVDGVTGPDEVSQERVRIAAERIVRATGLDVDITIGSSPEPQLIDLPAGKYGRPELTLEEGWSRKGVAVSLLSAVDRKSLTLFGLVLLVCVLFLLNATLAAVRARRVELGVLATLGWPARRIFTLLEAELLATGLIAGIAGTGLAVLAARLVGLPLQAEQLVPITPVAMLLAGLAGAWPAWRASRTAPLEAIRPAVRPPRRAASVDTITRLGLVGVARWPGRTALGAASLFVGVAALAVLVAIQNAFQGEAVGTLLGDAVAVQVRGVDYLAAGLTIALGAFAVADVAYLSITERVDEIGTLRASGWRESHVRRLFGTEATVTAALGALSGAVAGVGLIALLLPIPLLPAVTAAATATAAGLAAAVLALAVPLARTNNLAPAAAIAAE